MGVVSCVVYECEWHTCIEVYLVFVNIKSFTKIFSFLPLRSLSLSLSQHFLPFSLSYLLFTLLGPFLPTSGLTHESNQRKGRDGASTIVSCSTKVHRGNPFGVSELPMSSSTTTGSLSFGGRTPVPNTESE